MKTEKETALFNFNASKDVLNDLMNYIMQGVSINQQEQTIKQVSMQIDDEIKSFTFNHSGGGGRTAQQCQTYLKDKAQELATQIIQEVTHTRKERETTSFLYNDYFHTAFTRIFTGIGAVTKLSGLNYIIAIEEENKVQKIEKLKDFLNNNCKFYLLSIQFRGGASFDNYETVAKVEIVIQ